MFENVRVPFLTVPGYVTLTGHLTVDGVQTKQSIMFGTRSCLRFDVARELASCIQTVADLCWAKVNGLARAKM